MKKLLTYFFLTSIVCYSIQGCVFRKSNTIKNEKKKDYFTAYDDSTLYGNNFPLIMPYNRLIDAAGQTIYYGDSTLENHSLDAALLPESQLLAVEDRYGIAIIDVGTKAIIDRWSFNNDPKFRGIMSTYSGIKTIRYKDSTFIFWSAAGNGTQSYVMQAVWDHQKIKIEQSIAIPPIAPAPMALPNDMALQTEDNK